MGRVSIMDDYLMGFPVMQIKQAIACPEYLQMVAWQSKQELNIFSRIIPKWIVDTGIYIMAFGFRETVKGNSKNGTSVHFNTGPCHAIALVSGIDSTNRCNTQTNNGSTYNYQLAT